MKTVTLELQGTNESGACVFDVEEHVAFGVALALTDTMPCVARIFPNRRRDRLLAIFYPRM